MFALRTLRIATPALRAVAAPRVAAVSSYNAQLLRFYSASSRPSPQEVEDRILVLLKDFDKVPKEKLNLDAHFVKDLGLDSLDQVEITMAIEDEFGIELPDKDAEEIFTVRQAVEKVNAHQSPV